MKTPREGGPIQQSLCGAGPVTGAVALHCPQGACERGPTSVTKARDNPNAITGQGHRGSRLLLSAAGVQAVPPAEAVT